MDKKFKILFITLVCINMLNYLDRYILAAILEPLGKDLSLNDEQLGRLAFMFLIVYMCAAPLAGYLSDRMSRTKLVAGGIFLWSIATSSAALAQNYNSLMFTRALVGIGEAFFATLGPAILCDILPQKERASKFTWFFLAVPVGSALGFGLGGTLAGIWGWRSSFLIAGIPGLLFAAWMWMQPDPKKGQYDINETDEYSHLSYFGKLKALLNYPIFLACTASYVGYTFGMGALSHWAPTLFQRKYNLSIAQAGMVFGGVAVLTGILGTFLGGSLTKKFQDKFPNFGIDFSMITIILAAPAVWLVLTATDVNSAYVFLFISMLLLFINTSPVNAETYSSVPSSLRATGAAVNIFLIHLLGDALSPGLVGHKSTLLGGDGNALAEALKMVVIAFIIGGLALLFARKKKIKSVGHAV